MNECAFCEQGVRPFYTLDTSDGSQKPICHTCFHIGKHKQASRPTEQSTTVKPVNVKDQSTTGKR
jgi:hypothetical protein